MIGGEEEEVEQKGLIYINLQGLLNNKYHLFGKPFWGKHFNKMGYEQSSDKIWPTFAWVKLGVLPRGKEWKLMLKRYLLVDWNWIYGIWLWMQSEL